MNPPPHTPERPLLWLLLAASLALGAWWALHYQPRLERLAQRTLALQTIQLRNREARLQLVRLGLPGLEAELQRARAEMAALEARAPSDAEAADAEVAHAVTRAAAHYGVRVHELRPLPPLREEPFEVRGSRLVVAGRYHDVGALLTELVALPRLTQIRSATLEVVPDSLLRRAVATRSAAHPALASVLADARPGEPPFTVVADVGLHWFSLRAESTGRSPAPAAPQAPVPTLNAF